MGLSLSRACTHILLSLRLVSRCLSCLSGSMPVSLRVCVPVRLRDGVCVLARVYIVSSASRYSTVVAACSPKEPINKNHSPPARASSPAQFRNT